MSIERPEVGDVWVGEDLNSRRIYRTVTGVKRLNHCWHVQLDDHGYAHLNWWYGQGWSELEMNVD